LNSKLHAVCDGQGRPLVLLLSEGQMSDHKGARLIVDALPPARELIADRGYDSDWFRAVLADKGIAPCIPSTKSRKAPLPYDAALYKQRHKIENMFGRLNDWRASNPLRPMRPYLHLSHRPRRNRHLLAMINES
jgi:transposase